MAIPDSKGPAKLVLAPIRLELLKLRARSCGLLRSPTRFCSRTLYNANDAPSSVPATYRADISRTKYGIIMAQLPQTVPNRSSQREPTRSEYRPTGQEINRGKM